MLGFALAALSFVHKHQVNGANDEKECQKMVPVQMGTLEHDIGNDAEDGQRDTLLNDLQLNEIEGTAIFYKPQSVGRHLTAVLKKGDAPGEHDDTQKWPVAAGARLL